MTSRSDPITQPPAPFDYWTDEEASLFKVGEVRVLVIGEGAQTLATSIANAYRYDQMIKRMRVNQRETNDQA